MMRTVTAFVWLIFSLLLMANVTPAYAADPVRHSGVFTAADGTRYDYSSEFWGDSCRFENGKSNFAGLHDIYFDADALRLKATTPQALDVALTAPSRHILGGPEETSRLAEFNKNGIRRYTLEGYLANRLKRQVFFALKCDGGGASNVFVVGLEGCFGTMQSLQPPLQVWVAALEAGEWKVDFAEHKHPIFDELKTGAWHQFGAPADIDDPTAFKEQRRKLEEQFAKAATRPSKAGSSLGATTRAAATSQSAPGAATVGAAGIGRVVPTAQTPAEIGGGRRVLAIDKHDSPEFVMAQAVDQQGNIWVGTEDRGIYCYTSASGQLTQFTTKDGLGDDNGYALAMDKLGRIWVGHLNHGVSVYVPGNDRHEGTDGPRGRWQNYEVVAGLSRPDTLAGPLGERVFDIAVDPKSGDVWISSSVGLARYSEGKAESGKQKVESSEGKGTWTYYTRAEGLPSDQAQSLAFAADGTLYVGTQCDGVAIGSPSDDYKTWRLVAGPEKMPTSAQGDGLPTNLINDIVVGRDGAVYVATTLGLAQSRDAGQTWKYWRGADYADKVRGLYGGPPKDWKEEAGAWLREDYITCLAEDEEGSLWIGYRQSGYEAASPGDRAKLSADLLAPPPGQSKQFVSSLLPLAGGGMSLGCYGEGLVVKAATSSGHETVTKVERDGGTVARMPAGATAPTAKKLSEMLARVKGQPNQPALRSATGGQPTTRASLNETKLVGDDWTTQGDWVARYGRQYALLAATNSPHDDELQSDYAFKSITREIGPHHIAGDTIRGWMDRKKSDDRRALYNPCLGYRRQADLGDHGEAYPISWGGPDLVLKVEVPAGIHRLSLYFFNKDGHDGMNRLRDYEVALMPQDDDHYLSHARVRDFWGGTYKQFAVTGPGKYRVLVRRNGSFNTILSGLFIDKQQGPASVYDAQPMVFMGNMKYGPNGDGGVQSLAAIRDAWRTTGGMAAQRPFRVLQYRQLAQASTDEQTLGVARWCIPLLTTGDREEFDKTTATAFRKHLKMNGLAEELNEWPEKPLKTKGPTTGKASIR